MSTRTLLAVITVVLANGALAPALAQPGSPPCPAVRDVLITNGKIHTMNFANTVVDSVRIVGDRFAEVGTVRSPRRVALHAR